jgi:hypothetical protein
MIDYMNIWATACQGLTPHFSFIYPYLRIGEFGSGDYPGSRYDRSNCVAAVFFQISFNQRTAVEICHLLSSAIIFDAGFPVVSMLLKAVSFPCSSGNLIIPLFASEASLSSTSVSSSI